VHFAISSYEVSGVLKIARAFRRVKILLHPSQRYSGAQKLTLPTDVTKTGNGERGTGNREPGTGVWEQVKEFNMAVKGKEKGTEM